MRRKRLTQRSNFSQVMKRPVALQGLQSGSPGTYSMGISGTHGPGKEPRLKTATAGETDEVLGRLCWGGRGRCSSHPHVLPSKTVKCSPLQPALPTSLWLVFLHPTQPSPASTGYQPSMKDVSAPLRPTQMILQARSSGEGTRYRSGT